MGASRRTQSIVKAKSFSEESGACRELAETKVSNPQKHRLRQEAAESQFFHGVMKEFYEVSNLIHGQLMKLIELMDEAEKRRKITELIVNKYRQIRQLIAREEGGFKQATPPESLRSGNDLGRELVDLQFDISLASHAKDGDAAKAFVNEELKQLSLLQREALDFTRRSILSSRLQWFDVLLEPSMGIEMELSLYDKLRKTPEILIQANKETFVECTSSELLILTKAIADGLALDSVAEYVRSLTKEAVNLWITLDSEQRLYTPLHLAVSVNDFRLVQWLLERGADPTKTIGVSKSPIRYAYELPILKAPTAFEVLREHPLCFFAPDITEIIENLDLRNLDYADESQQTPLHYHAKAKHVDIVQALIKHGASIDREDINGKTPYDLAIEVGASSELIECLEHVVLFIGLSGQKLAIQTCLLVEVKDVLHFLKIKVRDFFQKQGKRVSYYSMRIMIGSDLVRPKMSWEALKRPKDFNLILAATLRDDAEKTREFLQLAEEIGDRSSQALKRHLEEYQNPDVTDTADETAAWKAARNNDVQKLQYLALANADLDHRSFANAGGHGDHGGATALFIASQHGRLEAVKFLADKVAIDIPLNTNASPLYVACQNGHRQVVEVLLKAGANPNLETEDKATPLFIAAQMGHGAIVKMLLANGADVEILNFTNASPLFIASQHNHVDIVKVLLEASPCVNSQTKSGASPTYIAAQEGSLGALKLLLDAGADTDLPGNDGATPLMIAAQHGHREAVRMLLYKGANIRNTMLSGATGLFLAAQNGHLEVVMDLVEADLQNDKGKHGLKLVDVCLQNGTSPLYAAAQNGHIETVEYLCNANADLSLKSGGAVSPFFIAAQKGHEMICRFLLEVDQRSKGWQLKEVTDDGSRPLLVAAQNGHISIVKAFIEEMQTLHFSEEILEVINAGKDGGASALYLAAQNGHAEVVEYLIHCNASVDNPLDTMETPLFIACQGGHTAVVEVLLAAGADVNCGKLDKTPPLYIACQNHHTHLIEMLLNSNANVDAINDSHATAIFISAQKGFLDIIRILLEWGADPEVAIRTGARPIYIAAMKGHLEVVRFLLEHGVDANAAPEHETTPLLIAIRNGHEEVADLLIESKVDVNRADRDGRTPLKEAIVKVDHHLVSKLISAGAEQKDFPIFYGFIRMLYAFDSSRINTDEFRVQILMLSESIERMERNVMKIHHVWDEMVNLENGPSDLWEGMHEISEDMKELTESQNTTLSGLYPLLMLVRDAIKQCNEDYQSWLEDRFRREVPKDLVEFKAWLNLTQASSLLAIFKKFLKQLPRKPEISMDVFQEVKNLHIFEKLISKRFRNDGAAVKCKA